MADIMALNQIRLLDKDQLMMVIRENGYDEIAEILRDKDITGQTILELPTFQLISWKLPAATIKMVSKFIEKIKKNPSTLIQNVYPESYPEKSYFRSNTSLSSPVKPLRSFSTPKHSEINNFKDKLKIALNSKKPGLQKTLSAGRYKKPLPPPPAVLEKLQSPNKNTTFFNINEPDETDFIPIVTQTSINQNKFTKIGKSVIDNQENYIVLREPVPLSKEVDLNFSSENNNGIISISNRKPIPIPIDDDYIDMEFNKIESPYPTNSNRNINFPFPEEESLKFISESNNNIGIRKPLPVPLEELSSVSRNAVTAKKEYVPMGEYMDLSELATNKTFNPVHSFNKNENKNFHHTHHDPKLQGGIFESLGKLLIKSKSRKGYENCEIEKNRNPTILNSTISYKNRPLPPIPRDEEIITNSPSNRSTKIRIHKSYDDNLMNKDKDGKVTRRSVDFNNERFFRNTDRKGAERLLSPLIDGAFLFRPSKAYYLALIIKFKEKFYNFGIERTPNMKIRLNADTNNVAPEFRTLRDFSEHFTKEPIAFKNDSELIEILLEPVLPKNIS